MYKENTWKIWIHTTNKIVLTLRAGNVFGLIWTNATGNYSVQEWHNIFNACIQASKKPAILIDPQFKRCMSFISIADKALFNNSVLFGLIAKCLQSFQRFSYRFLASCWPDLSDVYIHSLNSPIWRMRCTPREWWFYAIFAL